MQGKRGFVIFCIAITVIGLVIMLSAGSLASMLFLGVVVPVCLTLFDGSDTKKENEPLKAEDFTAVNNNLLLAYGLPFPEDSVLNVNFSEEGFCFFANGVRIRLDIDKICDVDIKTDEEIQTSDKYVSSTGKAVVGGLLFGATGAIIGSQPKRKTETVTTYTFYLIITYVKDNVLNYVSFRLGDNNYKGVDFVNNYRRLKLINPGNIQEFNL